MNFPKEKSDKVQGLRNWLSAKSHLSGDPGWGLVIHQEYVRARHPDSQKAFSFSRSHFLASCQSKASEENLVVMRCVLLDYFHLRENWVSLARAPACRAFRALLAAAAAARS